MNCKERKTEKEYSMETGHLFLSKGLGSEKDISDL